MANELLEDAFKDFKEIARPRAIELENEKGSVRYKKFYEIYSIVMEMDQTQTGIQLTFPVEFVCYISVLAAGKHIQEMFGSKRYL